MPPNSIVGLTNPGSKSVAPTNKAAAAGSPNLYLQSRNEECTRRESADFSCESHLVKDLEREQIGSELDAKVPGDSSPFLDGTNAVEIKAVLAVPEETIELFVQRFQNTDAPTLCFDLRAGKLICMLEDCEDSHDIGLLASTSTKWQRPAKTSASFNQQTGWKASPPVRRVSEPCYKFAAGKCSRKNSPFSHELALYQTSATENPAVIKKSPQISAKKSDTHASSSILDVSYLFQRLESGNCAQAIDCNYSHDLQLLESNISIQGQPTVASETRSTCTTRLRAKTCIAEALQPVQHVTGVGKLQQQRAREGLANPAATVAIPSAKPTAGIPALHRGRTMEEWHARCKKAGVNMWDYSEEKAKAMRNIKTSLKRSEYLLPFMDPDEEHRFNLRKAMDGLVSCRSSIDAVKSSMSPAQQAAIEDYKSMNDILNWKTAKGKLIRDDASAEDIKEMQRKMAASFAIFATRIIEIFAPEVQISTALTISPLQVQPGESVSSQVISALQKSEVIKVALKGLESPAAFVFFPALPPEIRHLIWSFAAVKTKNQLTLKFKKIKNAGIGQPRVLLIPRNNSCPVLMRTTSESRAIVSNYYDNKHSWGTTTGSALSWFCPRTDSLFFQTRNSTEFIRYHNFIEKSSASSLRSLIMPFRDCYVNRDPMPWARAMCIFRNLKVLTLLMSSDPIDQAHTMERNQAYLEKNITRYLHNRYEEDGNANRPHVIVKVIDAMKAEKLGLGLLTWAQ